MTDNHQHDWLEKVERLLQDGQPTHDALLNSLAGIVPQAAPDFEQALEERLVAALQVEPQRGDVTPMSIVENDSEQGKLKRIPRGLPVTLAATIALVLFGGLAVLIARGPLLDTPIFSGAAQEQVQQEAPPNIAWTATAIILQATYQAAQAQFIESQQQLQALERQATEQAAAAPGSDLDQAMTSVVQTATAVVQQATQRASGDAFLTPAQIEPAAATATAMIQRATQEAGVFWTATALANAHTMQLPTLMPQTCPPEKLVVYAAPGHDAPVLMEIAPLATDKYQVEGILTLNETGQDWFYVTFAYEGNPTAGWVLAETIRAACQQLFSSAIDDSVLTMLPPTVVPPPIIATPTPIPFSEAAVSPICPAQQLILRAEPGRAAAVVAELPFDASLRVEGLLTLNSGDSWYVVILQGVRGWIPENALPLECVAILHPEGVPMLDKMSVPAVPLPASPTFTATPVPSATMTATATATYTPSSTPFPSATLVGYYGDQAVQMTLDIPDSVDMEAGIAQGSLVNVLMVVPPTHDPEIWVPIVQRAYVLEIQRRADGIRVRLNLPPDSDTALLYQVMDAGIRLKLTAAP